MAKDHKPGSVSCTGEIPNLDLQIYGTVDDSIVDGPGLRFSVFVQGCPHGCPGCHNPQSHDPRKGRTVSLQELIAQIQANPLVTGVTITGGEPFAQPEAAGELARKLKEFGYNLWTFSGWEYEDLLVQAEQDPGVALLLEMSDVLVDGPYLEEQKSLSLPWCGSSNQRVIDLNATRRTGSLVLWHEEPILPSKPPSW